MKNVIPFPAAVAPSLQHPGKQRLYLHQEDTQAMQPALRQGKWAVWTPLDGRAIEDGLYLVQFGDDPTSRMVKHIQCMGWVRYRVFGEDPAYREFEVSTDNWPADFSIVGRVIGIVKRVG